MDLEEYVGKLLSEAEKIPTRYIYKIEIKFADGSKVIYPGDSLIVNAISKRIPKRQDLPEYTVTSYRMLIDVDRLVEDSELIYNELMKNILGED